VRRDAGRRVAASGFAGAAGLGADAAALVHLSVLLAFVGAKAARAFAQPQRIHDQRFVRTGAARRQTGGRGADIGAVEIGADALAQLRDHVFGQARVGAGLADLGVFEHLLDCPDENVIGAAADIRMRGNHMMELHGGLP